MSEHADYCPAHGIPMWYWPTGGTWACQRSTCEATKPVRWQETEVARSLRYDVPAEWPRFWVVDFGYPPRSRIFVTGI